MRLWRKQDEKSAEQKLLHRNLFGHLMAFCLVAVFIILNIVASYQIDFWQSYFYHDSYTPTDTCKVELASAPSTASEPDWSRAEVRNMQLPHIRKSLANKSLAPQTMQHVRYTCLYTLAGLDEETGITYLHLGWVYATSAKIWTNGRLRADFSGNDKVVIPLTQADMASDTLSLRIELIGNESPYLGLMGQAPLAITSGNQKNSKVFGLEIALQQIRHLYNVLPVLTLSIFLAFGWVSGLRSRILIATFYYFIMIIIRNLLMLFSDLWPWDLVKTYEYHFITYGGVVFAFVLFAMEILGIYVRFINKLYFLSAAMIGVELGLLALAGNSYETSNYIDQFHAYFLILSSFPLIYLGIKRLKHFDPMRQKINRVFLAGAALYTAIMSLDHFDPFGLSYRLSLKMDIIMPLFVGGVVLFVLASIEKSYREERQKREMIQARLELGRTVQELLLPADLSGDFGGSSYKFFYEPAEDMSGDWLSMWRVNDHETRLLIGDVTGKGPQAALAVSAIAGVIEDSKQRSESLDTCIQNIHLRLKTLFRGKVGTTLSAVVIRNDNSVDLYNCGAIGWLLVHKNKLNHLPLRGTGLGSNDEIVIAHQRIEPASHSMLFSFTDGVLEGSRALKSLQRSLRDNDVDVDFEVLKNTLIDAGKGHVLQDDKTILMVRMAA